MKKYFSYGLMLFLFFLILTTRGFFIPEVALSGECKNSSYESKKEKVHMIELYTSEGCSSCPPAEKWLNSLYAKENLWQDFVPMAFHVDYWDYIGWKDPMAKSEYSRRQRRYAREWQEGTVYTPGLVLNGLEWRQFVRRALPKASQKVEGILKAKPEGNENYHITFSPSKALQEDLIFSVALLGHGIENKIKRGENRGRTLKHNFVVLESKSIKAKKEKNQYQAKINIPKTNFKAKEYALSFWVSKKGSQKPLQVTGGCFNL